MPTKNQFGIFWSKNAFSFVETSGKTPAQTVHVPFNTPIEADAAQKDIPEDIRLTGLIQKTVREHNIAIPNVNLSLTTKDFIFRSFVIPWMEPGEVKNVVDFEATKYIPIPLEQLTYAFHPVTLVDNNQKNIRILFFAARKDLLERYTTIAERAGLIVDHIEPEPVSLARALQKLGMVTHGQSTAVIEIGPGEGKIILIEDTIVQFVREFQIPEDELRDLAALSAKLFNEIRVSLNFYTRQNPHGKIDQIVTLAAAALPRIAEDLAKEFNKPATSLIVSQLLKTSPVNDVGILSAFGATLRDKGFSTKNFELAERAKKLQKEDEASQVKTQRYLTTAGIVAGCVLAGWLTVFFCNQRLDGYKKKISRDEQKTGMFRSLKVDDLNKMNEGIAKKLLGYKSIRLKSNICFYLIRIPQILPERVWLKSFKIDSVGNAGPGLSITMEGYVYSKDTNEQFRMVNSLVYLVKKEENLGKIFSNITLDAVNPQVLNNHTVTSFRITCK